MYIAIWLFKIVTSSEVSSLHYTIPGYVNCDINLIIFYRKLWFGRLIYKPNKNVLILPLNSTMHVLFPFYRLINYATEFSNHIYSYMKLISFYRFESTLHNSSTVSFEFIHKLWQPCNQSTDGEDTSTF